MADSSASSSASGSAAAAAAPATVAAPLAWDPSLLSRYSCLIFDCDGVLWHESVAISGASDVLRSLRSRGLRLLFATNNSGKSRSAFVRKFDELGFTGLELSPEHVLTSSQVAAHYLASLPRQQFDRERQKVLTVGESGIGEEMRLQGIEAVEAMKMFGSKMLSKSELSQLELDPTIGAVVVGIDEQFTYTKAAYATALLSQTRDAHTADSVSSGAAPPSNPAADSSSSSDSNSATPAAAASPAGDDDRNRYRCLFVSTNQDSTLPTAGHALPGAGSVVSMLSTASGRAATNMGKPERRMFDLAVSLHGVDPRRTLVVGDRLDTDILFGARAGVDSLLITRTGVHSEKDVARFGITPTFVAPDVNAIIR